MTEQQWAQYERRRRDDETHGVRMPLERMSAWGVIAAIAVMIVFLVMFIGWWVDAQAEPMLPPLRVSESEPSVEDTSEGSTADAKSADEIRRPPEGTPRAYVKLSNPESTLNVRRGAGMDYAVCSYVDWHERVWVHGTQDGWALVSREGSMNPLGWVDGRYLVMMP